jgi:hypothetical protein
LGFFPHKKDVFIPPLVAGPRDGTEREREREMFRAYVGFLIHKERRVASVSTSFLRLEAIIVNNMLQSV